VRSALRPRLWGIVSNLGDRSGDVKPERFYVLGFCFGGGCDILVCLMSDARRFPPPWTAFYFSILIVRLVVAPHFLLV
jgi:hypothetical protein